MIEEKVKTKKSNIIAEFWIKMLLYLAVICLLIHSCIRVKETKELDAFGIYQLSLPLSSHEVAGILERNEEYRHQLLFFSEKTSQSITFPEFNKTVITRVICIYGDSNLLFQNNYPLEPSDTRGCLLGEDAAFALFGSVYVAGESLYYGGQSYEIRDVIPDWDGLVIEKESMGEFTYAGIPKEKEQALISILENGEGMGLTKQSFRFYQILARLEVFLSLVLLYGMTVLFLYQKTGKKQLVKKAALTVFAAFFLAGIIYVCSFPIESIPDRISDVGAWSAYFAKEWENFKIFLGGKEFFYPSQIL